MTRTRLTSALVAGLLATASVVLSAPAASAEDSPAPEVVSAESSTDETPAAGDTAAEESASAPEDESSGSGASATTEETAEEPAEESTAEAAGAAAPASISPAVSFSISPAGPWKGGQKVTVTTTGWAPGDSYTIFTCPKGVYPAANPPGAGCAAFTGPHGYFGVVDGSGKGTATITILQGSVDGITCEKDGDCTLGVYGIDAEAVPENTPTPEPITYVTADSPTTDDDTSGNDDTSGGDDTSNEESGPELAPTGAEQAAPYALWAGAALLAGTGLLLATRRRTQAHADE